jgi:subtilisin-like proprotein convertase family protein
MRKLFFYLLCAISFFTKGQTFSYTVNATILDTSTICMTIPVFGLPTAINSTFGLVSVFMNVAHNNDSHLVIQLQSPDGNEITLASGVGGAGQNFSNTTLAMNGVNGFIASGIAPFSGTYIPQQTLNTLNNGQNPNSVWRFCITDTYFGDAGTLINFSITFGNNPPPNPPPPPVVCSYCKCMNNADSCSLLPDLTASYLCIQNNHFEQTGFLKMSNATPNIGRGPIEIHGIDSCFCDSVPVPCSSTCPPGTQMKHKITQRIYKRVGKDTLVSYNRDAGIMTYHPEHHHLHVDDWTHFSLRVQTPNPDPTTWPIIGTASKQSFCLVNSGNCTTSYGYCKDTIGNSLTMANIPNAGFGMYNGCGLDQGIYPGNLDVYTQNQNNSVPLGSICNGSFHIVSITDPKNNFLESNENNNWVSVPITLTKQSAPTGTTSFNYNVNGLQLNFTNTSPSSTTYLWNYGDGNWDTIYNPKHVYVNPGTYSVSLVSLNNCYTLSSQTITLTGIDKYENTGLDLNIYQNPLSENSFITFYVSDKTFVDLEIFDISGRVVELITIESQKEGVQKYTLTNRILSYSSGIYFLKVSDRSGNSALKKMVVK